jgi:RNA polymerase sigma factor (sigma-70 family)
MADTPGGFQQNIRPASDAETSRSVSDQDLLARFLAHRDEAAFAALVHRYSGTVWGVCRRVLGQQQDAEDAFQAVFFLLARKAASIHKKEAVGGWLYGVAYRIAMKARQSAARRQRREKIPRPATPEPPPSSEAACRELQRLLDEEVQRLADKYRAPFVLCCLEGLSKAEAAKELGWKEGTVSWRLAQARTLLQKRLLRRGVTLSAVLTLLALTPQKAAVSAALLQTTVQGVLAALVDQAAATLSPAAVALTNSMMHGMATAKVKMGLAVLMALTVLTGGASLAAYHWKSDTRKVTPPIVAVVPGATQPVPTQLVTPGKPGVPTVLSFALSSDSKRLVTTWGRPDQPGQLKIRDTATAEELLTIKPLPAPSAVAFSPDGQGLAIGEFSGDIALHDAGMGQEQGMRKGDHGAVHGLAFSPDGAALASAASDGTLTLWNLNDPQGRQLFEGHTESALAVAFFHDGQTFVSGSVDKTAKIWDARTGQAKLTLAGHRGRIEAVAVSPDDRLVATASGDRTVRLWDAATGNLIASLEGQPFALCSVAFSPNGRLLTSGDVGGSVCLWDVQTHQLLRRLDKLTGGIRTLAFSADGQFLRTGNSAGSVLFVVDGNSSKPESFQEYYHSFKGNTEFPPGWELKGPNAEQWVHWESSGVRLTLPLGNPPEKRGTGIGTHLSVQGDFEITMGFEILQEPEPSAAGTTQTRVSVEVVLDRQSASRNMASLSRRVANDGSHFFAWQVLRNERDGQEKTNTGLISTRARTGRLRLKRIGSLLSYAAATGSAGDFTLFRQFPFGTENLKEVRLVGSTGSPTASLDVRITDVRIRAQSLPNLAEMQATFLTKAEDKNEEKSSENGWLWAAEFVGLGIGFALLIALGVWLLLRHSLRAAVKEKPAKPATMSVVSFTCSACGKNLKAKAELAGKKVKCSQCGKVVLVPETKAVLVPETKASEIESSDQSKWWSRRTIVAVLTVSGLILCSIAVLVYWTHRAAHDFLQAQSLDSTQYLDRPLGLEEIPGIAEEGFYHPEGSPPLSEAYRWTNGAAKLVIPLNGPPPKALHVRLVLFANSPRIHIRINGQSLFEERVSSRDWSRTFDLSAMSLGSVLTLEILSDTFIPAEQEKGNTDDRTLGVRVYGVTLLSGTQGFTDVPLGVREVPGVTESGFHGPEKFRLPGMEDDRPCRWTDGAARLTVPLGGKTPRKLALSLEISNLPECRLQVKVNGRKLFDDVVSTPQWQLYWSVELPLSGVDLGDSAHIELDSSTFVPAQVGTNPKDTRKLGVRVKRLILVTDAAADRK